MAYGGCTLGQTDSARRRPSACSPPTRLSSFSDVARGDSRPQPDCSGLIAGRAVTPHHRGVHTVPLRTRLALARDQTPLRPKPRLDYTPPWARHNGAYCEQAMTRSLHRNGFQCAASQSDFGLLAAVNRRPRLVSPPTARRLLGALPATVPQRPPTRCAHFLSDSRRRPSYRFPPHPRAESRSRTSMLPSSPATRWQRAFRCSPDPSATRSPSVVGYGGGAYAAGGR